MATAVSPPGTGLGPGVAGRGGWWCWGLLGIAPLDLSDLMTACLGFESMLSNEFVLADLWFARDGTGTLLSSNSGPRLDDLWVLLLILC